MQGLNACGEGNAQLYGTRNSSHCSMKPPCPPVPGSSPKSIQGHFTSIEKKYKALRGGKAVKSGFGR